MTSNSDGGDPRPWVLVISLDPRMNPTLLDQHHEQFFKALTRYNTQRKDANNHESVIHYLTAPIKPQAVLVTGGLLKQENIGVLNWVLHYARNGGRVIFCSHCDPCLYQNEIEDFFANKILVRWKLAYYKSLTAFTNPFFAHTSQIRTTKIPLSIKDEALYFAGVDPSDAVYLAAGFLVPNVVTPVIFKSLVQGWIGIVGLMQNGKALDEIILSLCGIKNTSKKVLLLE